MLDKKGKDEIANYINEIEKNIEENIMGEIDCADFLKNFIEEKNKLP